MKRPSFDENWPSSWKTSYFYDLEEVFGPITNCGYAYAYQKRRGVTLRLVTEVLPPGARILDVAAAQGNFSLALAEMGYEVTWNDLRAELADYIRMHERGNLGFAPGNAFELNLPALSMECSSLRSLSTPRIRINSSPALLHSLGREVTSS